MSWDVFISHASEDKEEVARPLYRLLNEAGLTVWLDEIELTIGDSLGQKIAEGLSRSRYGIVILSPKFLAKGWTRLELDGLISREIEERKIVLPVWHNLTKDDVLSFSPILASKLAANTNDGLDKVVFALLRANKPLGSVPIKYSIAANNEKNEHKHYSSLVSKYRLLLIAALALFVVVFSLYKINSTKYELASNYSHISRDETVVSNPVNTVINNTTSQYKRYRIMINTINELIPNSTKGYDTFNDIIWSHHNCYTVQQAVKINRAIGSALKLLIADIYGGDTLVQELNFNVYPLKSLIREIDQWDEDYGQLLDKNKSPCKMPMFAPMRYLMLRDDLIELKDELNQKLSKK